MNWMYLFYIVAVASMAFAGLYLYDMYYGKVGQGSVKPASGKVLGGQGAEATVVEPNPLPSANTASNLSAGNTSAETHGTCGRNDSSRCLGMPGTSQGTFSKIRHI